jgi:hypothetical protein
MLFLFAFFKLHYICVPISCTVGITIVSSCEGVNYTLVIQSPDKLILLFLRLSLV